MKIKSTFKDYYDHVAHIYGGGDPKCVYVRMPFEGKLTFQMKSTFHGAFHGRFDLRWSEYRGGISPYLSYKILVIAGKAYLLASKTEAGVLPTPFKLFTPENLSLIHI